MLSNLLFIVANMGSKQGDSNWGNILFFGAIFLIMYLFLFAPQRRKQKEHQQMMADLKNGDKVLTVGGIIGVIASVKDNSVVLKVGENIKIEFSRTAIAQKILPPKDAAKGSK
ncbi:preprotein translocase subunit YajC [candidate division KSB1 bacterium]|nr:preprotein translocase subunit YajC [candidate division KSB1 bacterium]